MGCMIELGELEKHHEEFDKRNVRVVVASIEDQGTAKETQKQFPHLLVAADKDRSLANAAEVIHPGSGPGGIDTAAPTTILIDRNGTVRYLFRSDNVLVRLSPEELAAAIDGHLVSRNAK
jgi:peroxiredoxin